MAGTSIMTSMGTGRG